MNLPRSLPTLDILPDDDDDASSELFSASSHAPLQGTFALVTLGCPKNLVDSERMLGLLRDDG